MINNGLCDYISEVGPDEGRGAACVTLLLAWEGFSHWCEWKTTHLSAHLSMDVCNGGLSIPRRTKAGAPGWRCCVRAVTLCCWFRRKSSPFGVRGLGLCLLCVGLLQKQLLNFIHWSLVTD